MPQQEALYVEDDAGPKPLTLDDLMRVMAAQNETTAALVKKALKEQSKRLSKQLKALREDVERQRVLLAAVDSAQRAYAGLPQQRPVPRISAPPVDTHSFSARSYGRGYTIQRR